MDYRRIIAVLALSLGLSLIFSSAVRGDTKTGESLTECKSTGSVSISGIDLDVTYISRTPRYEWNTAKKWPDPGEVVTFTAHIRNKGTIPSAAFGYQWKVDNKIVFSGTAGGISPAAETTQTFNWVWRTGRHTISFQVDPQGLISETAENNNILIDYTDAMTLGFWVEQSVYAEFNAIQNGAGTYSWEDWAQRIVQNMNRIFEQSVYPEARQGGLTRVRLDNITIVPDGTLFNQGPWHSPSDYIYDGRWGFSMEEYHNCQCCSQAQCYDIPWWVIHELMHYLYSRIDLYAMDVQGGDVLVRDEGGNLIAGTSLLPYVHYDVVYYEKLWWDMMHNPGNTLFSNYTTYSLNMDWPMGERTHRSDWEHYFLELPADNRIRVLDNHDLPMNNVQVSIYQALPGDGTSGPYSQYFDNTPDIVGTTDSNGLFSMGAHPFGDINTHGTPSGVVLVKLKKPVSGLYRYVWLELTDFNKAYWRGETNVYIHAVHFPEGSKRLKLSATGLSFTAREGTNPIPQDVEVGLLGQGVGEWSVSKPSASWLRTIPSLDLDTQVYPFGPLTFIVDDTGMSPGTYTSTVSVSSDASVLDNPQTVTVTLVVYKAQPTTTVITNTAALATGTLVGQSYPVTFSVTSSAGGNPSGYVTVSDGTDTCVATLPSGMCNLVSTTAGAKSLTAAYAGDSLFGGSTSIIVHHNVGVAGTTTLITSDLPDPSGVGQAVTIQYSLIVTAPGSGAPNGNVIVSDGAQSCTGSVAAGGCSITFATPGVKLLTAMYAGDANFSTSTSATESHAVLNRTYLPLVLKNVRPTTTVTIPGMLEDGEAYFMSCTLGWATCRNSMTGSGAWTGFQASTVAADLDSSKYTIERAFLYFDTSSLPSNADILSSALVVYAGQWQTDHELIHVVQSTASTPLSSSSYGKVVFQSGGSATFTSPLTWVTFNLQSSALGWIARDGITKLALIHDNDLLNIVPTTENHVLIATAEDQIHSPYLVVTYSLP